MSKTMELKTATDLVKDILKHDSVARNNDDYLYYRVCQRINPECACLPFYKVILQRKTLGLPAFESVRRTRQKVQACHPEYAANDTVEGFRAVNEEKFKNYARKVTV